MSMGKSVAILTDSNSGITQNCAKALGISVLPMPFYINDELFYEDITLTQEEFYRHLEDDAEIHTSMPVVGEVLDRWDSLLKDYDEVVYIPMSSGLSNSCQTAKIMAQEYDGKVEVVNNQRISVTQKQSVLDAVALAESGKTAAEIREILEKEKFESSIYITLDTLKYLKKGGRITPAAAAIGTVLNLKPVLQIQGEKLDSFKKARGKEAAKKIMIEAVKNDLENKYKGVDKSKIHMHAAYSGNPEEAEQWVKELEENFPGFEINADPLSLSVSCHIGHGALAVATSKSIDEYL